MRSEVRGHRGKRAAKKKNRHPVCLLSDHLFAVSAVTVNLIFVDAWMGELFEGEGLM